jgi:hypothetical protein
MKVEIMALLIPIFSVVGFFTMIVFLRYFQNIERMTMIEKGMDIKDLQGLNPSFNLHTSTTLKIGFLAVGAGLGMLIAAHMEHFLGDVAYPAFVLMFGGAGLLVSYFVSRKIEKSDK